MAKQAKFEPGDYVVYPAHGLGKVMAIETRTVAGFELDMLVIEFEKEKMTLRIPLGKVGAAGLRSLSSKKDMGDALKTLKGRVRVKRTMWSRRAQEYEAKINSGSLVQVAEVVRDLYRNAEQPDQSYSERQIYQAALERLTRELAAVDRTDEEKAQEKLEGILSAASTAARAAVAAAEAEANGEELDSEVDDGDDADDSDETEAEEAA
jgi:CarD family transcriptional regulator